ncbi:DNA-binding CsgD family transcriptional regulator [Duganella sp. 1224]|uniref:helix-turn-helix domain-containing protein n=1 Tax=Duganella sp. 1224 TaxID=2587052 RepID=UPI0015CCDDC6|nr:helix-turn-helix transcriptional regulator [Duganella sp. 1224]NYE61731.1 DNA-binding CsgD family transcriptional regulator [Duganella sp. 1224]
MDIDSSLLLELYRAARVMPVAEFPEFALGLLRPCVGFDSARLLTVEFAGSATLIRSSTAYNVAGDHVLDWDAISRKDLVLSAIREQVNRPISFHVPTLFASPEYSVVRDYAERYEHTNGLCVALPDTESGYTDGLSLYRARSDDHFGVPEQLKLRLLMPHLIEALKLNRELAAVSRPAAPQGALLIARTDGSVQYCTNAASTLLAKEWSDWHAARLPARLLYELGRPGIQHYEGAWLSVLAERIGDLLFLRLRPQSPLAQLSPREREVARKYSGGASTKEIAAALGLSPATVRNFVQRIYQKLSVGDKATLASLLAASQH